MKTTDHNRRGRYAAARLPRLLLATLLLLLFGPLASIAAVKDWVYYEADRITAQSTSGTLAVDLDCRHALLFGTVAKDGIDGFEQRLKAENRGKGKVAWRVDDGRTWSFEAPAYLWDHPAGHTRYGFIARVQDDRVLQEMIAGRKMYLTWADGSVEEISLIGFTEALRRMDAARCDREQLAVAG